MPTLDDLLARTQEVVQGAVAPRADAVDRKAAWPRESLRALQDAGLGGLVVPVECGGLGQGLVGLCRVCEVIGHACSATALCFGMHGVASAVIAARATRDQQQRYLEPIALGEHLTTLALSEPGTGAHFYFPQSRLDNHSEDSFRVTGTKSFVTNGGYADSYVVSTTAADPAAPPDQFSCVVIPGDAPGLAWGPPWQGIGMRGNSSRTVDIQDVVIPRGNLLGEQGDQLWYVFEVVAPYFLMAMAGTYLGIADAAFNEALDHLRTRRHSHSGTSLAQQPVIQYQIGQLWAEIEQVRQLVYAAARAAEAGDPNATLMVLSAKAQVADMVVKAVNEALMLCGGAGYAAGARLERCLRDAQAAPVMSPTTNLLRLWTGRQLLDVPLLG
ncbi:MAG TPA: acyl-CoA dehydrogenase family protein [Chloroflexota bacterium]|jgi:alkylation response protein AidB-like acyl-CoA dehydrogenase